MSALHYVFSPLEFFRDICGASWKYCKTYRNFITVLFKKSSHQFPIDAVLKNGDRIRLKSALEAQSIANGFKNSFEIDSDLFIIINKEIPKIKLLGWNGNGDVFGVFFDQYLLKLSIKDNDVVDIGANIGDSSIYFAIKNAKRIIALEPLPKNYEIAKKNIEINNLGHKIELILAGCGEKNEVIKCNSKDMGIDVFLNKNVETKNTVEIPMITLAEILKRYNLSDSCILKMDCEGHEYDIIISASKDTLIRFSEILIEYHYGYKNLKEKLEESGFVVNIIRPYTIRTPLGMHKRQFIGLLYAKNKSKSSNYI